MNSLLSALFIIILFSTLFVECGSINQPEPSTPAAIPTVTGLPDQPEEIDSDLPDELPDAYPVPEQEQEIEVEAQSYPAPTQQNTSDAYPAESELPAPYPDPYPDPES